MTGAPLPYRGEDLNEDPQPYKEQVRGIVPGYGGHVPRGQHCYGITHYGKIDKAVSPKVGSPDSAQMRHPATKQAGVHEGTMHKSLVGGIIPGYAGHVPVSQFVYGQSAQGGTVPFSNGAPDRQGRRSDDFLDRLLVAERTDMQDFGSENQLSTEGGWWPSEAALLAKETETGRQPSYRDSVGGVIPGYSGHVPKGMYKVGATNRGKTKRFDETYFSQAGMPATKAYPATFIDPKVKDPYVKHVRHDEGPILPGYTGFTPGAAFKVGGTHTWTEDGEMLRRTGIQAGESTEEMDADNAKDMRLGISLGQADAAQYLSGETASAERIDAAEDYAFRAIYGNQDRDTMGQGQQMMGLDDRRRRQMEMLQGIDFGTGQAETKVLCGYK